MTSPKEEFFDFMVSQLGGIEPVLTGFLQSRPGLIDVANANTVNLMDLAGELGILEQVRGLTLGQLAQILAPTSEPTRTPTRRRRTRTVAPASSPKPDASQDEPVAEPPIQADLFDLDATSVEAEESTPTVPETAPDAEPVDEVPAGVSADTSDAPDATPEPEPIDEAPAEVSAEIVDAPDAAQKPEPIDEAPVAVAVAPNANPAPAEKLDDVVVDAEPPTSTPFEDPQMVSLLNSLFSEKPESTPAPEPEPSPAPIGVENISRIRTRIAGFITEHPWCSSTEVASGLNLAPRLVEKQLDRLVDQQTVKRQPLATGTVYAAA